ncbi:hypothetical protein ACVD1S_22750 [Escherichia coli]
MLALTYQGLFHFIVQQNGCSTVDRNIVLGLHLSRPQSKPETGKLQAPAVILPLLSKMAVYLYSKSCFGLLTPHLIN